MTVHSFADPDAKIVLIQTIEERSLPSVEEEVRILQEAAGNNFCLKAITVDDWSRDLSPWEAPAAFGNIPFGGGADQTLQIILSLCKDPGKDYYLGGYSLSGLFALWAAFMTDTFSGIAAASPSLWFPDFCAFTRDHDILCDTVYLSLGDKESNTKNKMMATVGSCVISTCELLRSRGVNCIYEENHGNHFTDVEKRCARAFSRVLEVTR